MGKCSNQFESLLQEVEQRRLLVDLHELERDFFEGGSRLGKVHRALDVVAQFEAMQSLLRVELKKDKQYLQDFFLTVD